MRKSPLLPAQGDKPQAVSSSIRILETHPVIPFRTPASASAEGDKGSICFDGSYIYVCVDTNTWERAALSTW